MASNVTSLSLMCLRQQPALRDFFTHRVGRDAWEDAYHALWLRLQTVRDDPPIEDFSAFLFYLARLVALDHGRKERRYKLLHEEVGKLVQGRLLALPVDHQVIARDQLSRLTIAVKTLPEPTRTIFALNRMENLTHREIADRLHLSQTTVGKHVTKALRVLSLALGYQLSKEK